MSWFSITADAFRLTLLLLSKLTHYAAVKIGKATSVKTEIYTAMKTSPPILTREETKEKSA